MGQTKAIIIEQGSQIGYWTVTGSISYVGKTKKVPCRCICGKEAMVNVTNLLAGKSKSCGCYSAQLAKKRIHDLTGKVFGQLTVLEREPTTQDGRVCWLCACSCGNTCVVKSNLLVAGKTKSCGCLKKSLTKAIDLTGQQFGRLTVQYPIEERSYKGSLVWRCKCSCGNQVNAPSDALLSGHYVSCGCQRREWQSQIHHTLQHVDNTCIEYLEKRNKRNDNTSGYQGVQQLNSGKYRAYIGFKGKRYNLGSFVNYTQAVEARRTAEEQLHKEYVRRYYRWLAAADGNEAWKAANPFSIEVIFNTQTKEFALIEKNALQMAGAGNK